MRQVFLDTETTGLDPAQGHRLIELGCVELKDRRATSRVFHHRFNPEREIDKEAYEKHGMSREDLEDKPLFRDFASEFVEFVRDSEVIAHNASFDADFINAELALLGEEWGRLTDHCRKLTDSLEIARELRPGQRNNLDALCTHYQIDNSHRDLHGALVDAKLLAQVYLAMTGGQEALLLDGEENAGAQSAPRAARFANAGAALRFKVIEPTPAELEAHREMMARVQRESAAAGVEERDAEDKKLGTDAAAEH